MTNNVARIQTRMPNRTAKITHATSSFPESRCLAPLHFAGGALVGALSVSSFLYPPRTHLVARAVYKLLN